MHTYYIHLLVNIKIPAVYYVVIKGTMYPIYAEGATKLAFILTVLVRCGILKSTGQGYSTTHSLSSLRPFQ